MNWSTMTASNLSTRTVNPIRSMHEGARIMPNSKKSVIQLNVGDPSVAGNLPPSPAVLGAVQEVMISLKFNGYGHSYGIPEARQAVVKHFSTPEAPFNSDDVIMASGAAHALQLIIEAIADWGENILIPVPGFPIYKTHANAQGIEVVEYKLDMKKGEVDLFDLRSKINSQTKAIIVNNPSNPTGFVFSKQHLIDILRIAEENRLVVIADEIYGDIVYGGKTFHPIAGLNKNVPIVTVDGITKRYLVPGWRLGWLIFHNRHNVLSEIKQGVVALTQQIVGPCTLIQGALPLILRHTPKAHFDRTRRIISENVNLLYDMFDQVAGLQPMRSYGAMFMMVRIDENVLGNESAFLEDLIKEESVFCANGSSFGLKGSFRVLLTLPTEMTRESGERIINFVKRRQQQIVPKHIICPRISTVGHR